MALLLRPGTGWLPWEAPWDVVVGALEMERERIPATRTASSLQQLCSRYSSDSKLLGKRKQSS